MKEKKQPKLFLILLIVGILAVVAIVLVVLLTKNKKSAVPVGQLEAVVEQTTESTEADGSVTEAVEATVENYTEDLEALALLGITLPEKELDWNALHEQNPDIYAWIVVPGTDIDFPVVQREGDKPYYLNNGLDASGGNPDFLYSEDYNSKDFSDFHTVLYGRSDDDTGFATIHNFEEDGSLDGDHYIYVYTEDGVYVYRVFGAYEFPAIHLLLNFDLTNEYVREQYLKEVFAMDETEGVAANLRHDIDIKADDHIITLSTCVPSSAEVSDHDKLYRYMLAGVQVYPEEQE